MRLYIIGLSVILILTAGCKNNENQLLLNQQEILKYQMDTKSAEIAALYQLNKVKYKEIWQTEAKLRISFYNLKEDFRNNTSEIDKIISYSKHNKYPFEYDHLSYSIENALNSDDESLKNYAINNILILINEILYKEIEKSQSRDFHYTNIEPYVELDKKYYRVGDHVNAKIFIKAFDTTQRPVILVHDGLLIDSFSYDFDGLYSTIASEKGTFKVNGNLIYMKPGSYTQIDSTNFSFEYKVK